MKHSEALIATPHGSQYIRNLCSHWAHSFRVVYSEQTGHIELPQTICKLVAAPSSLLLQLELHGDADRTQMENAIEEHLRRVATDEELHVNWRRRA